MGKMRVRVTTQGKRVTGASVTVYIEKPSVAQGNESSNFSSGDKATIYSDYQFQNVIANPGITDTFGEFEFFVPGMTVMAIQISKASIGTRWHRFEEPSPTDIL
jgi:hypothetical protein